jgi:carboxymethylenebutenolidase
LLTASAGFAVANMTPALAQAQSSASGKPEPPPTRVLDDPSIEHHPVTFTHYDQASIGGYLARPRAEGRYPAVIVIAGSPITEEYIPNTCAALAVAGFIGLAPDVFHFVPPGAATNEQIREGMARHTEEGEILDLFAGLQYLRGLGFVRPGGVGVLGFCHGGRMAMIFGARSRDVDAVVAYHPARVGGPPLDRSELERLSCPVQIHSGTIDGNVPVPVARELGAMLDGQGTPNEVHIYEGADHGFLAYTRPHRYHPSAAILSWRRTVEFLTRTLRRA